MDFLEVCWLEFPDRFQTDVWHFTDAHRINCYEVYNFSLLAGSHVRTSAGSCYIRSFVHCARVVLRHRPWCTPLPLFVSNWASARNITLEPVRCSSGWSHAFIKETDNRKCVLLVTFRVCLVNILEVSVSEQFLVLLRPNGYLRAT